MLMFSNYHEQKKVFLEIGRHAFLFLFHRLKRTIANQGRVKFGLFRPRTVIYVGNDTLFTFTKIGLGDFKKSFSLAIIVPVKCDYILTFLRYIRTTCAKYPYRRFPLVPFRTLPRGNHESNVKNVIFLPNGLYCMCSITNCTWKLTLYYHLFLF